MEKTRHEGVSHETAGPGTGTKPTLPTPEWVRRLFLDAGVVIPEQRLAWNAVHIEQFLRWCRRAGGALGEDLPLGDLARHYLEELKTTSANDYRREQARQALAVFYRGINHWRLEPRDGEHGGWWEPKFRLKTAREGAAAETEHEQVERRRQDALRAGGWRKRMAEALRVRQYSIRTERSYLDWAERFVRVAGETPSAWSSAQVRDFLTRLAVEDQVMASTQNQALSALLFLFRACEIPLAGDINAVRAKRSTRVPVVLGRGEIARLFGAMEGTAKLMATLMYGSGMRIIECCRLRIKDVDFERQQMIVWDGKGAKDRVVMLPERLLRAMREHRQRVRLAWESDRKEGVGGVWIPPALARKFPSAPESWEWFWFFPSGTLSVDPREIGAVRRHHVHENGLQRALAKAARTAGIAKHVKPHTLRHSFCASLRLPSGYTFELPCLGGCARARVLPPICWKTGRISVRCRRCWVTRAWKRP